MGWLPLACLVLFVVSCGQINGGLGAIIEDVILEPTTIEDDFIFQLRPSPYYDADASVAIFINAARGLTGNRAEGLGKYKIGNFIAARLKITPEDVELVKEIADVEHTQQNVKVLAYDDGDCETQQLSLDNWGLARISSQQMPAYSSETFSYLNEDGKDVDVFVVDTGLSTVHEEYEGRIKQAFVAKSHLEEGPEDLNGHGTHVASIIAGNNFGVAKQTNLINVKVLNKNGEGSLADLLQGMQFIYEDFFSKRLGRDNKAKGVVNFSLGIPGRIHVLLNAVTELRQSPLSLPIVAAAGNDYGKAWGITPAGIPEIITVGASTLYDSIAPYSNSGPEVDIFAPGTAIIGATVEETYETLMTATMRTTGTSNAAALVSGVIARHLSQSETTKTPEEVKDFLIETATHDALVMTISEFGTPNRLLYTECWGPRPTVDPS